jgi:selenocysteine lyase/cysteine desulfurase
MVTSPTSPDQAAHYAALERSVETALESYANVHRGVGQKSAVSTQLYEEARERLLAHWGWRPRRHTVIFGSPYRIDPLLRQLPPGSYRQVRSRDLGLPLGLCAVGVERRALRHVVPEQTGGGTVQLVSRDHVIPAAAPERFEAGTPALINTLTCVRALTLAPRWQACGPSASLEELLYADDLGGLRGEALLAALRRTVLGRGLRVPTVDGPRPYVNLDNAASTPTFAPIWHTVRRIWRQPEALQQAVVADVYGIVARFLHAPATDYEMVFTANTTEALNLAARGMEAEPGIEPVVLNTTMEHNSNELPWRNHPGVKLRRIPVGLDGFVDHELLEAELRAYHTGQHGRERIVWVALSGASNVLGACNDLPALAHLVHRYGARLLVDGAQLVAHRPLDLLHGEIDAMAFSGHKVYAPFGSGALVVRRGLLRWPSGELARARASGEENVVGIAALGKALTLLERIGMPVVEAEEQELTSRLVAGLAALPGIEIFGLKDPADPGFNARTGVVAFSAQHVPHNLVGQELAERGGIGVRCGCFCAHLLIKQLLHIHSLRARAADLGLLVAPRFAARLLPGLVRVSLGLENSPNDVAHCLSTLKLILDTRRPWLARSLASTHNGSPFLPHTATGALVQSLAMATVERAYGPKAGIGRGAITPQPTQAAPSGASPKTAMLATSRSRREVVEMGESGEPRLATEMVVEHRHDHPLHRHPSSRPRPRAVVQARPAADPC